jgi:ubiquinol oxidase
VCSNWFPYTILDNLYDVFVNIRDDEAEHCKTMAACQTPGSIRSPHSTESRTETDVKKSLANED